MLVKPWKTPLTVSKPSRVSRNPSVQLWPLDVTLAPNNSRCILLRSATTWLRDLIGCIFVQVYYIQFIMHKHLLCSDTNGFFISSHENKILVGDKTVTHTIVSKR